LRRISVVAMDFLLFEHSFRPRYSAFGKIARRGLRNALS
jgi:hypothetical protein